MIDRDRQRGLLMGLAIGDALGAAVEFKPPGSFPEVTGFRAGGPHGLAAGEWTDDTSMALALADSLAEVGWDIDDQARRYLRWWQHGDYSVNGRCFDIGSTTVSALHRFQETGNAYAAASRANHASGNGCIMRLAPVPIYHARFFPDRLDDLIDRAVESSLPTHASDQCLSATAYLTLVLTGLVHGLPRETVLADDWQPVQRLREVLVVHSEVDEVIRGSYRRKQPPQIRGSGYVVHCLEASLWAFHDAPDFRTAVLRAVNLGDDADTTGAVAGQLAGAFWGESGIPIEWRENVASREMLEKALEGLLK